MRNLITKKSNYSLSFMGRVWGGVFLLLTTSSCSIAQSIKVNQVGYYPSETKVAVIEPTVTAKSFTLKDAKGKKVWAGKAVRTSVSPFTQKVRQIVDFSTVKTPGTYTFVAGKEEQKIVIKDNAFADVAKAAMKAFYLQRTGMPIEEKYAGVYARPAAHPDNKVLVHETAASPLRPAGTVISSPYGWYDAGDFNKYIVNSGFTVAVLLQAAEQVHAHELAAAQALVGIVDIKLSLAPLQPDDLSIQLVAVLIDLHIRLIVRRDPLSEHVLRISGYGHQRQY